MNIKEERDLFRDHWFKENLSSDTEAYDSAWLAWLASRNREGYVLVPIKPTQEMLDKLSDVIFDTFGTTNDEMLDCASITYETLTGAYDE